MVQPKAMFKRPGTITVGSSNGVQLQSGRAPRAVGELRKERTIAQPGGPLLYIQAGWRLHTLRRQNTDLSPMHRYKRA